MGLWATTPLQHNKVRHCAEHALDMRPKSRRAKSVDTYCPPSRNCVVLPSTSEHNISDDAARTVAANLGPNQPTSVGLQYYYEGMDTYLGR